MNILNKIIKTGVLLIAIAQMPLMAMDSIDSMNDTQLRVSVGATNPSHICTQDEIDQALFGASLLASASSSSADYTFQPPVTAPSHNQGTGTTASQANVVASAGPVLMPLPAFNPALSTLAGAIALQANASQASSTSLPLPPLMVAQLPMPDGTEIRITDIKTKKETEQPPLQVPQSLMSNPSNNSNTWFKMAFQAQAASLRSPTPDKTEMSIPDRKTKSEAESLAVSSPQATADTSSSSSSSSAESTYGKMKKKRASSRKNASPYKEGIEEGEKFVCVECDAVLASEKSLQNHVYRHKNKGKFMCKEPHCNCGRSFIVYRDLERHVNVLRGNEPFSCKPCKQSFTIESNYKRHLKIHRKQEKEFECTQCNNAWFNSKRSLDKHEETCGIEKEKKFPCDGCSLAFTTSQGLTSHKKVHKK